MYKMIFDTKPTKQEHKEIKDFFQSYLLCALWVHELELKFDIKDIETESLQKTYMDCRGFLTKNYTLIKNNFPSFDYVGHDFYLTRHRHGTGFWDREFLTKSVQDELTKASKRYRETYLEDVYDKIYIYY